MGHEGDSWLEGRLGVGGVSVWQMWGAAPTWPRSIRLAETSLETQQPLDSP